MTEELQWINGVYGEVATADCYKIRELDFVPEIIYDLGANVGSFARHARDVFPNALIISVEPNEDNCRDYERLVKQDNKIILIQKAIGIGSMWHYKGARDGTGEVYLNASIGYPEKLMVQAGIDNIAIEESAVNNIMLDELINAYVKEGQKFLVKTDIEGNETAIWEHEPSMQALMKADYICMEIHQYALHGKIISDVRQHTFEALARFIPTHKCQWVNTSFYARKR